MTKRQISKHPFRVAGTVWLTVFVSAVASGGEPARQFLQGLRDRGYYDTAVDYLNMMKTSKLAPVDLKETLMYDLGSTLIEASRLQRDIALREKQLDEARDALNRFVGQHPEHPLIDSANSQLGNLLVERARIKMEQSKRPKADKAALLAAAKQQYEDAYKVFARAQNDLKERLAKRQVVDPKDAKAIEARDQLRADYLQVQLLSAAVREETVETLAKGSQEYNAMLTEAAAQYGEVYDKYRTRLAGLYARMYQGRCHQKLGKLKEALTFYGELLEQPDNPEEFRTLKLRTLQLAAEAWLTSKPPLHQEAVKLLQPWIENARPSEERRAEWMELRLALAEAQWGLAESAKKAKATDPQVKRLETDARRHALFVSRQSGDLQAKARELVARFGGPDLAADAGKKEPKTFTEAKDAGREVLDALQSANLVLQTYPARIAAESDAKVKEDLQTQMGEAQQTVKTAVQDALGYYQKALELADDKTSIDDLNIVRYFLCFLTFTANDFYDAGLLGEFVARRYPNSSGARQCAKIAMAAYLKLYVENTTDDKDFESRRLTGIANYIAEKWPDQPEAIDALNTLVPLMIKAGKLDEAERYLNEIPSDSPKRGEAEIKTGQAMWSEYLQGMQEVRKWESGEEPKPDNVDLAAKKATLDQIKARAQKILEDGVARMKSVGKVDESAATASLSLAQIYVDTEQASKAVAVLEDAQLGPLTLVTAGSPATQRPGFAGETYKSALRAYISSLAGAKDATAIVKKATDVMAAMKEAIPPDQLIVIYVSLARDLEQQMKLATPEAKRALSMGFETFLKQIRGATTEFSVLNWVAETFSGIAAGFDTAVQGKPVLTAEAKKYYEEALTTYQTILDKVQFDDPKLKTQILLRQGNAYRHLFQFSKARDIYRDVLKETNTMLNIQVEAAKLFQEWAALAKDDDKTALYMRAMAGSEKDPETGKNILWGWGRLFQVAAKYPNFRDVFHEARYNLALCRFNMARVQKSKSDQQDQLNRAKDAILQTQQLFGSGPEWDAWKPRYDALMKEIQKSLRERPLGLPEGKVPGAAATPAGKEAGESKATKPAPGPPPLNLNPAA
jgi:hypothetical protein